MLLKRLYNEKLAQASYLLGCEKSRAAIVVDPLRDIEPYLAAAESEKLRIEHVTETHIHADFLSGSHDLARATGAQLHLSAMGGSDWQYNVADRKVNLLTDGSTITIGAIRIEAVHTPGHTPEHLTFLVTDSATASAPAGAITGDFIFVGDVGRPDLLETAAGFVGTKEDSARQLFRSIQEFKKLPDYLQIWPGHGAGSACGKSLGGMPQSTLGYERLFNWALVEVDEHAFIQQVLSGQPDPPAYFAVMKQMNRDVPPSRRLEPAPVLSAPELAGRLREGATVVDTRAVAAFSERHAQGAINLPWTNSFLTYGGSVLPYDRDLFLIVTGDEDAKKIIGDLSLIGLDRIGGVHYMGTDVSLDGVPLTSTRQMSTDTLAARMRDVTILDVRGHDEWDEGHIPGAIHIPLGTLAARLNEIPRDKEVAVHCQGGTRSAIATSILQKNGISASNVSGGLDEWERAGRTVAH